MKTINTCCGSNLRKTTTAVKDPIPTNPKVKGGVAVIFLGAGNISVKGQATGNLYYASDHSRHFSIDKDDVKSILRRTDIILKP